jgi:hypothetical protein
VSAPVVIRWLKLCHQTYDDELVYEKRNHDTEQLEEIKLLSKKDKFLYLFDQLTHSVGECSQLLSSSSLNHSFLPTLSPGHHQSVIQVNDAIKLFQLSNKKGRKSATNKDFIYAKVLGFLPSCENLRLDQVSQLLSFVPIHLSLSLSTPCLTWVRLLGFM